VQYRCDSYASSPRGLPQSVAYPAADVALVRARAPAASSVPAASPALPLARGSTRDPHDPIAIKAQVRGLMPRRSPRRRRLVRSDLGGREVSRRWRQRLPSSVASVRVTIDAMTQRGAADHRCPLGPGRGTDQRDGRQPPSLARRRPGSVHGFQPPQQMLGDELGGLLLQPMPGVWDHLAHAQAGHPAVHHRRGHEATDRISLPS
jgi:hypothetical protein